MLFLRLTLLLDKGMPKDSRRKGRGRTESELTGGFAVELLIVVRWPTPLTRGGEWMAVGEETRQMVEIIKRGKMPIYKL